MRKLSKNKVEDDTVSSTNGSVTNEGNSEQEANGGNGVEPPADEEVSLGNKEKSPEPEATPKDPPKKRASKARASKKVETIKDDKDSDEEDGEKEEEYEVEKVMDSKKIKGKLHYLIRWKGYSADSDTWEPEKTVSCTELINKFKEENKNETKKKSLKRKAQPPPKKEKKKGKASPKKAKTSKDFDYDNADENAEYEVERILEVHHKKSGKREFLIHWKGWSNKHDSWEPEEHLNCSDLIKKFMTKVESARGTESRALRVAPESTRRFTLQQQTSGRRLSKRGNQQQRVRYDGAD